MSLVTDATVTAGGAGATTGSTVTVTVAVSVPPFPSEIVYSNVASPLKFASGVKVTVPSAFKTTVPSIGLLTAVIVNVSPSKSVSFGSTMSAVPKVMAVSSSVTTVSSPATGALFTGSADAVVKGAGLSAGGVGLSSEPPPARAATPAAPPKRPSNPRVLMPESIHKGLTYPSPPSACPANAPS